ncbi:acyltransferase family protein [Sphingomonas kyungheensis]|uniref:Acyltransferase n=1 Tax=Sphingomonas kyungheensis TaxID=1069987 RepID=A0ABU8H4I7_9SPHN
MVRLILASMVVAYHSYVMTGLSAPAWYSTIARGDLAVAGFFGLSGYMVTGSYDRARDVKVYFLSRLCRIYPAYAASIMFALIIGLSVSTLREPMVLFVSSIRYLLANLSLMNTFQPTIPGAFEHNIHQEINTAWWTLKIEVAFYFILPGMLVLIRGRKGVIWAILIYMLGYAWSMGWNRFSDTNHINFYARMARQLPGWTGYFAVGASAYFSREHLMRFRWPIVFFSGYIVALGVQTFDLVAPLAITMLVLSVGLIGPHVPVNRFGDISFGIYVYHSPIIQLLIWSKMTGGVGILLFFALTMTLILPIAWLSWTFIERPAMEWAKARHKARRSAMV